MAEAEAAEAAEVGKAEAEAVEAAEAEAGKAEAEAAGTAALGKVVSKLSTGLVSTCVGRGLRCGTAPTVMPPRCQSYPAIWGSPQAAAGLGSGGVTMDDHIQLFLS